MFFSRVRIRPGARDLHLLLAGNGYGAHRILWKLFPEQQRRSFLFRDEIARDQIPFQKGVKGEPVYYLVSAEKPVSEHPLLAVESKSYSPRLVEGDRLAFKLRANPTVARKEEGKKNSSRHDVAMDAQYHFLRELAAEIGVPAHGDKSTIKKGILSEWSQGTNSIEIEDKLRGILSNSCRYAAVSNSNFAPGKLLDFVLKVRVASALETWFVSRSERLGFKIMSDDRCGRWKLQSEGYQWHALPKKGKGAGFSSVDFEGVVEVTDSALFEKTLFDGIGPAKAFGCGLMLVRRV